MGKDDTLRLDTHALLRRLEDLEIKQGWVADRIGVSRKTVRRWCTGKVERLARVYRRAGALDAAAAQVAEGMRRSADFPELTGMMRLALARDDDEAESKARATANEAFTRAGLGVRVRHQRVREHGAETGE